MQMFFAQRFKFLQNYAQKYDLYSENMYALVLPLIYKDIFEKWWKGFSKLSLLDLDIRGATAFI